jgi:hypothetical protein
MKHWTVWLMALLLMLGLGGCIKSAERKLCQSMLSSCPDLYDSSRSCEKENRYIEECRADCVGSTDDCEEMAQCLWGTVGDGGLLDEECGEPDYEDEEQP